MQFQFLKFDEVLGEKYIGIATIRVDIEGVKLIFRFKINPKEGGGFYCQPASHKISAYGKETYVPAFSLDSSYDSEEMKNFVLAHVQGAINSKQSPVQEKAPIPSWQYNQQTQQPPVQQPQYNQYRQDHPPVATTPPPQSSFLPDNVPF
jgi:hypothetical protein